MKLIQRLLPAKLRRQLRVLLWRSRDWVSSQRFAAATSSDNTMTVAVTIAQPLLTTPASANKVHNISLALQRLNGLIIAPGETFSFWRLVGNPSAGRGYKKSRSIIGGKLVAETGGGLCQLSGVIYYLAIQAGLQVTERHAHSLDIYTEEERYTPLGSDATVAFGHKDLRFVNNLPAAVGLRFTISGGELQGSITSSSILALRTISFSCKNGGGKAEVTTLCDGVPLCTSVYTKAGTSAGTAAADR